MAAVIQRVVAVPTAHTEFLHSQPNDPEVWGEKADAFIFKTHALADALAVKMREAAQAARHESGQLLVCFVHARALENSEWNDFVRAPLGPASAKTKKAVAHNGHNGRAPEVPAEPDLRGEVTVHMDPRRAAEVRRDPAEAYG